MHSGGWAATPPPPERNHGYITGLLLLDTTWQVRGDLALRLRLSASTAVSTGLNSGVWIALGGYAAERNHGYFTGLLLLGLEAGTAAEG